MYYSNITNSEIQFFHGLTAPNFTITLTQLLESDLFKVETIKTNLYKIYPLFYTETITTNNPNDIVIDDQVILCQKQEEKETFLTFISGDGEVQDYQNYANYYDIGDSLTENEYNSIVSLLRHNIINEDPINMLRDTTGTYGNYLFSVDGCTVLDTGLVVNDETRSAEPKVMLTDNVFHYSTYTLKLEVLHFTGVNVLDGDSGDYRVVDTLEIELLKDTWVPIPLDDLEDNYIISLDAVVEIKHDKPEIHMIEGLTVNGEPDIIQSGDSAEVYAQLIDYGGYPYNINDASGKTVYFFEQLTPTFTLSATPNPIESGDTTDIYSTVKDSDGSVAKNTKVYFFKETDEDYLYFNDGTTLNGIVTPSNASSSIVTEGIKYTTSSSGEKNIYYDVPLTSNDNFEFECEIAKIGVSQSIAMYIRNSTTATGCWFSYEDSTGKFGGGCTGSNFSNVDVGALAVGDKIKITYVNGVLSIYKNTSLIYTKTTTFSGTFYIGHYTNNAREQYVKNIKIRYVGDD